jgi:hypothetical protein
MYIYNSNFSVNKSINNVFNLIYEVSEDYSNSPSVSKKDNNNTKDDNEDEDNNDNQVALDMKDSTNINANLFKILEWNINNNWDIINGRRKKIESIYIYVNDFPKYLKELVVEDDNYIRMLRKHTIINDGRKYKVIVTKSKITNLKLSYSYIIKALSTLKIVKIKEKVSLTYINDRETIIDVSVKANIPIIINDDLEKYLNVVFQSVLNNIKKKVES